MVIQDTTTGAQCRQVWPVNIPNCTSSNLNYVGFTAGTAGATLEGITVLSWSYWDGYNSRLATPTFSPSPGQYAGTQSVTLSGPGGASLYYTTDGKAPTTASTLYTGAIAVTANDVVQAIAVETNFTDSFIGQGIYKIGTSNTINYPSGFSASSNIILCGVTILSGSAIRLTDSSTVNAVGAAWYAVPVTVSSFTTAFTLQYSSVNANGLAFCIQNNQAAYSSPSQSPAWSGGPSVISANGSNGGYAGLNGTGQGSGGILNSVALYFDLFSVSNSVGLYTDGAVPSGSQIAMTGINLSSGHAMNVTLTYSGTTLAFSITDSVTTTNFTHNFTIDIPGTVGASTAYVGFVGATGGGTANQFVNSWTGF